MKYLQPYAPRETSEESRTYLPVSSVLRDLALPTFSFPSRDANQYDLEIARTQANTYRDIVDRYADVERWRLETLETLQLIGTTERVVHHTIDAYMSAGMAFRRITAKSKLGWSPFAKQCKITVECEPICPSVTISRGWLR